MGHVYRAHDSRLNRDVAIKVLPPAFAGDSDRMKRFSREAQVLAALNHPNIAAIYGLEESEGQAAIVMELVEGQTLAERLRSGPLRVEEALEMARQIADALDAAHEKGIVHRDLKPANLKITPEGKLKVLDFGLAKAFDSDSSTAAVAATNSPTLTAEATRAGQIMGTAAYMSPEQARGKAVDKRADIWAFGLVLHEMLTGAPMFQGETVSDILAGVLRAEIDLSGLPAETPPSVRRLLLHCLRRNPNQRLRDIGDARIEIDSADEPAPAAAAPGMPRRAAFLPWAVAAVLGAALLWAVLRPGSTSTPQPVTRWVLKNAPSRRLFVSVSRDGSRLAWRQSSGLILRQLDGLEETRIPDAEGVFGPVFSPDGKWILFSTALPTKLRKAPTAGGLSTTICDADASWGDWWGEDDTILFSNGTSIFRVAASGGTPEQITSPKPGGGEIQMFPQMLPGGKQAIFTVITTNPQRIEVGLLDLRSRKWRVVAQGGGVTRYVPTGHLVYYRGGALFAVPFDLTRMAVVGNEAPVIQGVAVSGSIPLRADYSFSDTGLLVYLSAAAKRASTLAWIDRAGTQQPITSTPQLWEQGRLSPDGARVAITLATSGEESDLWLVDTVRGTTTRITNEGTASHPIWSPDGRRILYQSMTEGKFGIYAAAADGSGSRELLATAPAPLWPTSMTPDGRTLVYTEMAMDEASRIMLRTEGAPPRRFHENATRAHATEDLAQVSPDGKWLAYTSTESGSHEVYIERFPESGAKVRISTRGGADTRWARNMREVFYWEIEAPERSAAQSLMAVTVDAGTVVRAGAPRKILEQNAGKTWDLAPDGKRFLVQPQATTHAPAQDLIVVTNWFDELRRKAPRSK